MHECVSVPIIPVTSMHLDLPMDPQNSVAAAADSIAAGYHIRIHLEKHQVVERSVVDQEVEDHEEAVAEYILGEDIAADPEADAWVGSLFDFVKKMSGSEEAIQEDTCQGYSRLEAVVLTSEHTDLVSLVVGLDRKNHFEVHQTKGEPIEGVLIVVVVRLALDIDQRSLFEDISPLETKSCMTQIVLGEVCLWMETWMGPLTSVPLVPVNARAPSLPRHWRYDFGPVRFD